MKVILGIFNLFICFLVFCQTEKRPNILFIISDDQDAETLDFYGDKSCDTPVIDQLSKDGISLTSAITWVLIGQLSALHLELCL